MTRTTLAILAVVATSLIVTAASLVFTGNGIGDTASGPTLTILVKRTGANEAGVLGTILNTPDPGGNAVELLVNGSVVASTRTIFNGEYWFTRVPISEGATIRTRAGPIHSDSVPVPAFRPQPVPPPGFVYAQGTRLMRDGQTFTPFGVNEATAFTQALIASDSTGWGKNSNFPKGPTAQIPNVTNADEHWREYFRYFLHFRQAGDPTHPPATVVRIWIVDNNFGMERAYNFWKANESQFWYIFDRMLHWASRAGVSVVPVLGQNSIPPDNSFYNTSSTRYAHNVELSRAIVQRYRDNPIIAMWDLWNEPDSFWDQIGNVTTFRTWVAELISDIKPYDSNHLITVGSANNAGMPGSTKFGWRQYFDYNDILGLDVANRHVYDSSENQSIVDFYGDWNTALGIPQFDSEYAYYLIPSPVGNPLGYGYWPWYTERRMAGGIGGLTSMVFLDNGKGAYADYPYNGTLPSYPPVARFTFDPVVPDAGKSVTFDGGSSYNDDGLPITRYRWEFGDGQIAEGKVVQHTYESPGDFSVRLTVWDAAGGSNWSRGVVRVLPDTSAPSRIVDLAVSEVGGYYAVLEWTSPGDDGDVGNATSYDIRVSTTGPLNETNFMSRNPVPAPTPLPAGSRETLRVVGLEGDVTYWFAIRSADEVPNWSPVSVNAVATIEPPSVEPPSVERAVFDPESNCIDMIFTEPMNQSSVTQGVDLDPSLQHSFVWVDGSYLRIVILEPLREGTVYQVTITNTARDADGDALQVPFVFQFQASPRGAATADPSIWWLFALVIPVVFLLVIYRRVKIRRRKP